MRIPTSTYRLQLGPGFGFEDARRLVPYLAALGIGDLYTSPILAARSGSEHGYDVTDPTRLNPELGPPEAFNALVEELRRHGMGLLLDIVPNHMAMSSEIGADHQALLLVRRLLANIRSLPPRTDLDPEGQRRGSGAGGR